ncbi:MAG TPA: formate dehydrogenase accessory sulfurtransferase FdhD [Verrucomicrobiae bacterium]|nr:formate dehydrogenase accessory sulfurtransferase FdhD [Verrucomicrobiae bacterium]
MNPRSGKGAAQAADLLIGEAEVWRYSAAAEAKHCQDRLAREEPLEIRVRGRGIAVTMRTPGHDEDLAAGFLLSEGIIRKPSDITAMGPCARSDSPENTLNVFLAPSVRLNLKRLTRHVFASSSCGLCGKASIDAVQQEFPPVTSNVRVSIQVIRTFPGAMRAAQPAFEKTGGLHAAAVFTETGELIVLREDVGRHNAVDKVIGYGLRAGKLPFADNVLLVSGRASFEIMQKALAARVPIVCAVSAPSSLAVEFARESGQTLVGFIRGDSLNVYAGRQRLSP